MSACPYDIFDLLPMGEGVYKTVYALDEERVLKVPRNPSTEAQEHFWRELTILQAVHYSRDRWLSRRFARLLEHGSDWLVQERVPYLASDLPVENSPANKNFVDWPCVPAAERLEHLTGLVLFDVHMWNYGFRSTRKDAVPVIFDCDMRP